MFLQRNVKKKKKQEIYLDYAAQTPVSLEVFEVMKPWLTGSFGNPSAIHNYGKQAKEAISEARSSVQLQIGATNESQIVFTSGGTESNTMAIRGVLDRYKDGVIITSMIEHPSVRELYKEYEQRGFEIVFLEVSEEGRVIIDQLDKVLEKENIRLVSIMMVNNEIGTIQPISKISKLVRKLSPGTIIHTDASQAPLYLSCNVQSLDVDLMTLCGQKIYGPQGSGMLYIKEGVRIEPLFVGGKQESGMRAGTEPIHQIVSFAKALELATENRKKYSNNMLDLKQYFLESLESIPHVLNGSGDSLPLAINISFANTHKTSEEIVSFLNVHGIYVSSKSACMGSDQKNSYVIDALNREHKNSIRFSFGKDTTEQDIDYLVSIIKKI